MTATLVGSKNERNDATTAVWSRSSTLNSNRSVDLIGNCTSTTPPASSRVSSKPARSNTPSIDWFSESTSATKRSIPTSQHEPQAAPAIASRSLVPAPRPRRRKRTPPAPGRADARSCRSPRSAPRRRPPAPPASTALGPVRLEERLDELRPQVRKAVEAAVQALARKRPVEVEQSRRVGLGRWAQAKRPAVAQDDVDRVARNCRQGCH